VEQVALSSLPLERFARVIGLRRAESLRATTRRALGMLAGRVVWNVNSTAAGGGVAEMLRPLLGYARGVGVDARWLVIRGEPEFFVITKRVHNGLHGAPGDGGPLGDAEHAAYGATLARCGDALRALVRPRDVVILHDPQTAGLVPILRECGAAVIWRCHVGHDPTNAIIERTWAFLRPWVEPAHAFIFSRAAHAPPWLGERLLCIVPPSIDAFSVKNEGLRFPEVRAILRQIGLVPNGNGQGVPAFHRHDGTPARVGRRATIVHEGALPDVRTPLVVQVSRWDRLKDMAGVMHGFARYLTDAPQAHLALVGPDVRGVSDDPEGATVYAECVAAWRALPEARRRRIHLVSLPLEDGEENAAMVNAIQRHAAVVVQKSLAEGFGLTVTEAMWKGRPIVASAVGGIQDQILHGRHGLLVADPTDLAEFGGALRRLLHDRAFARRLGRNAQRRCVTHFLAPRHLTQYVDLLGAIGTVL
jgi:trehalose synthase